MEASVHLLIILLLLAFSNPSLSRTVVVHDAAAQTEDAVKLTLFLGDTLVFKHKNCHAIYVFRSWKAFESCRLAKATVLLPHTATTFFKWSPPNRGNYYFSFGNNYLGNCSQDLKMKIRVLGSVQKNHSSPSPAPAPIPGAEDSAQPTKPFSEPWLMIPRGSGSENRENPFVSSNPVIPLPVGTTDDINRPLPETGDGNKVTKLTTVSDRIWLMKLVFFMLTPFILLFS